MKVLYDYQMFDNQKIGGISRYFFELMANNKQDEYELSVKYSDNEYLIGNEIFNINSNPYTYENFLSNYSFKGKYKLHKIRNKILNIDSTPNKTLSIEALKKQNFDIFHPTYYDPYFLEYIGNKPFVLTIHDMIHEKYPEMFNLNDSTSKDKRLLAEKATHIIAISEYTKKDIIDLYGINENKISVIYHGTSLHTISEKISNPIFGEKYILYTGSRTIYKNFYFFIKSISTLLKNDKSLNIVCTASKFTQQEIELFKELGIQDQVHHFFADDSFLFQLYQNSQFFIFPSYYEGFGIPILEAFEAKCPLLLANASCFPEIARDAALYFDPKSSTDLLQKAKFLLDSLEERNKLVKLGEKRLTNFSWIKTTEETINVYRQVLKS